MYIIMLPIANLLPFYFRFYYRLKTIQLFVKDSAQKCINIPVVIIFYSSINEDLTID